MKEIFEIVKNISSTLDVDALLKRLDSAAEKLLDCEASSIMLLDEDKEHLTFKVASGEKGGIIQKMKLKIGQGIAGSVAQEKKPLTVEDAAKDPRFDANIDKSSGFVTKSIACVPMFAEGELVGVMEVLNKKNGHSFNAADMDILQSIAALAAVSINNAKLAEDQRNFFINMIEILISCIESKDQKMVGHSWRVAQLATKIGKNMGIKDAEFKNLYYGALLHDIGLLGLRTAISVEQGVVTLKSTGEPETTHPRIGSDMVRNVNLIKGSAVIIRHHHENYDGTGYPDGLAGEKIPLAARIVALAESIDEMRIGGIPENKIMQMVELGQDTRFDPRLVGLYLKDISENNQ